MKITIEKQETVQEIIDVEFPYYYKSSSGHGESTRIVYGKIIADKHEVTIQIEKNEFADITYEIRVNHKPYGFEFKDEYKSTKEEFEGAKAKLMECLKDKF